MTIPFAQAPMSHEWAPDGRTAGSAPGDRAGGRGGRGARAPAARRTRRTICAFSPPVDPEAERATGQKGMVMSSEFGRTAGA